MMEDIDVVRVLEVAGVAWATLVVPYLRRVFRAELKLALEPLVDRVAVLEARGVRPITMPPMEMAPGE